MRLTSARFKGIGRLADTEIKLDQKLIAIVGPNEAGKSTLLNALAMAGTGAPLPILQRSRGSEVPDATPYVTLRFTLDAEDLMALRDLQVEEAPARMTLSSIADGRVAVIDVHPTPRKPRVPMIAVADAIVKSVPAGPVDPRIESDDPQSDETPVEYERRVQFITDLKAMGTDVLQLTNAEAAHEVDIASLRTQAVAALAQLHEYEFPATFREALESLVTWIDMPDPNDEVRKRLRARVPDMALFTDEDRALQSSYTLDRSLLDATPRALRNLAQLADLSLVDLVSAVEAGAISRRNTLKNLANKKLAEHFSRAWQQSNLTVELNIENKTLRIGLIEDEVFASVLDERSQGLRAFVALSAFLSSRGAAGPTVLLIDEAENHLHINAQADLVEMFAQQSQAEKVIYTTHSPACLPADLGVGIRAVVVDGEEVSHVENSFWRQTGPALTTLMIAMGASAAAFTPARCVVVAEGASDMILLPTLMRSATGLKRLPYQVAPGLSELPRDMYPNLDLEAARVAYLVDGDAGGADLARAVGREIPGTLIVSLRVPGVENLLTQSLYTDAIIGAVRDAGVTTPLSGGPSYPDRSQASWAKAADAWLLDQGVSPQSKVVVASIAAESAELELDDDASQLLREVHADICRALGVEPGLAEAALVR